MKAHEEKIIEYLMNGLPLEEKSEVEQLIQSHPEWRGDYSELIAALQTLNNEDLKSIDPPAHYWNGFVPRLHERMERKQLKRTGVKKRMYYAIPALGFAALILFFTHAVLETNKKIDYLLDNSLSNLMIVETSYSYQDLDIQVETYFNDNANSDDPLKELTSGAESLNVTYELRDLSNEEKSELLSALETTKNI